jgi:hypothetical protein
LVDLGWFTGFAAKFKARSNLINDAFARLNFINSVTKFAVKFKI